MFESEDLHVSSTLSLHSGDVTVHGKRRASAVVKPDVITTIHVVKVNSWKDARPASGPA